MDDAHSTEFSLAAYRFGHSMIRPVYRINQTIERRKIFDGGSDFAADLGGMRVSFSEVGCTSARVAGRVCRQVLTLDVRSHLQ